MPAPFRVREAVTNEELTLEVGLGRRIHSEIETTSTGQENVADVLVTRKVSRIGGTTISGINRCERETSKVDGKRKEEQDVVFPYGKEDKKAAEEDLENGNCDVALSEIRKSVSEQENPSGAIRRREDLPSSTPTTAETPTRGIRFGDEMWG